LFDTVLIANRGEIALRVARACRELGIRSVAVYSTADRDTAVVGFADDAVQIGPPPARRSYANAAALVEAARRTGAEAIHPGYGFLSEDPDLAQICAAEGLVLIGPPPGAMATLADKSRVRSVLAGLGLPVLPGSPALTAVGAAVAAAADIGYPVMLKAAAGGGGRGLGVVRDPAHLAAAFAAVRAMSQATFGDGRIYLERLVESARHVEVQVLADQLGAVIHLGERDCSVQRRHQKLVEETPAPGLEALAPALHAAAITAARALGLVGAATVEFLVDDRGEFWLIEVNPRIQVEHPVTEMASGVDLVREQILVAAGRPLSVGQAEVRRSGAAVECRINAEDPDRDFVPTPGRVDVAILPGGPFTRVDTHVRAGASVPPDYDPLLAKIVVWAPDRRQALARLDRALTEVELAGPGLRTNRDFLREVLAHPLFQDGKHTTALVEQLAGQPADGERADRTPGRRGAAGSTTPTHDRRRLP
jgi:acetyl-CoA carboxylase biotin carboxylase subunit